MNMSLAFEPGEEATHQDILYLILEMAMVVVLRLFWRLIYIHIHPIL